MVFEIEKYDSLGCAYSAYGFVLSLVQHNKADIQLASCIIFYKYMHDYTRSKDLWLSLYSTAMKCSFMKYQVIYDKTYFCF